MTKNRLFLQFIVLGIFFNISPLHGDTNVIESEKSSKSKVEASDESKEEDKKTSTNDDAQKSEGDKEEEKPPKIGNFVLPASQQPAALFGFGGNIIDKNEIQFYFFADDFIGKHKITVDLIPSILFGITDTCSIYFNFPFTPLLKDGHNKSRGIEDFFVQLEYAFYNHSTYDYVDQATILANITFPTGSIKKNPSTGFGSPSLFIGATYYRVLVDWFAFTSHGAVLTCSDHGTKVGDQFLYQFGIGRNFPSPEGWIFAWIVEIDGQYNKKNRVKGKIDNNSGGNTIYATPSLWISSKELLVQFGVSLPINQNLFGNQHKFEYVYNLNLAWSFY